MSEHHRDHISKDAGAASAPRHAKREEGSQKNPWPVKKKRQVAVLSTLLAILLVVVSRKTQGPLRPLVMRRGRKAPKRIRGL